MDAKKKSTLSTAPQFFSEKPSRRIIPWKRFIASMSPNWLMRRREISKGAKLCYARLAQYAGQDGACFPKQCTLASELGVSERTVNNYITTVSPTCSPSRAVRTGALVWLKVGEPIAQLL
jgi:Helix-turn-helix domain